MIYFQKKNNNPVSESNAILPTGSSRNQTSAPSVDAVLQRRDGRSENATLINIGLYRA